MAETAEGRSALAVHEACDKPRGIVRIAVDISTATRMCNMCFVALFPTSMWLF